MPRMDPHAQAFLAIHSFRHDVSEVCCSFADSIPITQVRAAASEMHHRCVVATFESIPSCVVCVCVCVGVWFGVLVGVRGDASGLPHYSTDV